MSSVLSSQSFVIAAAMVASSTALFLAFSWQNTSPPPQFSGNQEPHYPPPEPKLRSCLRSGSKRRERKNKKVKFAATVKEPKGNGENYRRQFVKTRKVETRCRNEIPGVGGIPENRIALYNGILKNREQRMEYSY